MLLIEIELAKEQQWPLVDVPEELIRALGIGEL